MVRKIYSSPEYFHPYPKYDDVIRHSIYSNLYIQIYNGKSIRNRNRIKEKFALWLIWTCARNRSLWKLRCSVHHILLVSSFELAGKSINSGFYYETSCSTIKLIQICKRLRCKRNSGCFWRLYNSFFVFFIVSILYRKRILLLVNGD